MADGVRIDQPTGTKTVGHEWDGIEELDTPMPRWWLYILYATIVFAVVYCVLYPALPGLNSATPGTLGWSSHGQLEQELAADRQRKAPIMQALAQTPIEAISKNPALQRAAEEGGHSAFSLHCVQCHGSGAAGGKGYPNLNDDDWLWGGDVQRIAETISVGVNSANAGSRLAEMPRFGVDQMLPRDDIETAANYIFSLSNPDFSQAANIETITAGREVFLKNCATCHGEDARGKQDVGAPNLTDTRWIYGGDLETIITTIHGGRRGHMPTWDQRLTRAEIKILALYVHALGDGDS